MNKDARFQLFRYQVLPVDRYFQGDMLNNISTVDELIAKKNEFVAEALKNVADRLSDQKHQTVAKFLLSNSDFFLIRLAANRSVHIETKDFTEKTVENWPSVLVAIWNDPNRQLIAVQKRTTAFAEPETVVKIILTAISGQLEHHQLRMHHEPLFEKQAFWEIIDRHNGKIRKLEFEIVTPNMANISGNLPDDLKVFAKETNSVQNKLSIESDPSSSLRVSKESKVISGLVDYSSEGGGNITVQVSGIRKHYKTSKTVKEVSVDEIALHGTAEEIAVLLRELMK